MEQLGQDQSLAVLEAALRRKICGVCGVYMDRNVDGTCSLNESNECVLFAKLPGIAQAISRVHSDLMDDYVTAIREDICSNCAEQHEGLCKPRDEGRCVLDRHLLLIVDAIEEARGVTLQPSRL